MKQLTTLIDSTGDRKSQQLTPKVSHDLIRGHLITFYN